MRKDITATNQHWTEKNHQPLEIIMQMPQQNGSIFSLISIISIISKSSPLSPPPPPSPPSLLLPLFLIHLSSLHHLHHLHHLHRLHSLRPTSPEESQCSWTTKFMTQKSAETQRPPQQPTAHLLQLVWWFPFTLFHLVPG